MICAPSLEKRYYHCGAVGGCAKHADRRWTAGRSWPASRWCPAPLEPKGGKGL